MIVNPPVAHDMIGNYTYMEPDIEEFRDYEELLKLVCYYKTGKIDREFFKERLFVIGLRKLSDEDLDQIVDDAALITDNAIDLIGIITFIKRMIEAGTGERFLSFANGPNIGIFRTFSHQYQPFLFEARPFNEAEVNTYALQINKILAGDKFCGPRIPINPNGYELYDKLTDGVILARLIDIIRPGLIILNEIHTDINMSVFEKYDNLNRILAAAKAIGINIDTIPDDILDGNREVINDILGYILTRINVPREAILMNPETALLCKPGETVEDVANLPLNEFLDRWMGQKLKEKGLPLDFFKLDKLKDLGECKLMLNELFPGLDADAIISALNPDVVNNPNAPINTLLLGDLYNADSTRNGGVYDKGLMNAYVQKINDLLPDANLPMPENREFFDNLNDGILMAKLENLADKNIIPKDALILGENLAKEEQMANLNQVIKAGKKLGLPCFLQPIDLDKYRNLQYEQMLGDMLERLLVKPQVILKNPETPLLVQPGETIEDVARLPVDQFLKRWVNKHLADEGLKPINNLGPDLSNGKVLGSLFNGLAPNYLEKIPIDDNIPFLDINDILGHMERMGVETHINPQEIVDGKEKAGQLLLSEVYNNFANPYNVNEKECYSRIINHILDEDEQLKEQLPITPETGDLFKKLQDGLILSKLINIASPETLDERVLYNSPKMTDEEKAQNLNLVINSAKSLGCLAETTNEDILEENRERALELLNQILRQIVFKRIGVAEFPQIIRFLQPHEEVRDILRLGPDDILKRWVNYHLKEMGLKERLINFSEDLRDSKIYAYLLKRLNPEVDISFLQEPNLYLRAQHLINEIPKVGANVYVTDSDIVTGNINLNKFLLAELFLSNNGLGEPTKEEVIQASQLTDDDEEVSREERSFRTWVNSLRLEGMGKINNLYEECKNGILLLRIIDRIIPGIVKWEKVDLAPKNIFKIGVNCQEAIDASKRSGIKVVSIGNKDIQEGSKKHILSLVWQLMREQTLRIIGEKNEDTLINWGNSLVSEQRRIQSLREKKLSDALFWIELLEAIRPNCIRWEYVATEVATKQDREMNAKYALSVARALGAVIFIVWEDITEVRSKLLLTFLASLYDVSRRGGIQQPELEY